MIRIGIAMEGLKLRRSLLGWITFTLASVGFLAAANPGPGDTPLPSRSKRY